MDHQQFCDLALRELPAVYRMARHLCSNAADADDLVQQTYLNAIRGAQGFELTPSGIRPWLFKILHNVQRSRIQRTAHQPTPIDDADRHPDPATSNGDGQCGYIEVAGLDWDQVDERLKHAIHALPLPMRSVFLLIAVEGLRYRQVAQIMDIPMGTVMSMLFRARRRLLKMLSQLTVEQRQERAKTPGDEQNRNLECYQNR